MAQLRPNMTQTAYAKKFSSQFLKFSNFSHPSISFLDMKEAFVPFFSENADQVQLFFTSVDKPSILNSLWHAQPCRGKPVHLQTIVSHKVSLHSPHSVGLFG